MTKQESDEIAYWKARDSYDGDILEWPRRDAFQTGRESLVPLIQQLVEAARRRTNLSDMDAAKYAEKYECEGYAYAVDCFERDVRTALAAAAEQGFVPEHERVFPDDVTAGKGRRCIICGRVGNW